MTFSTSDQARAQWHTALLLHARVVIKQRINAFTPSRKPSRKQPASSSGARWAGTTEQSPSWRSRRCRSRGRRCGRRPSDRVSPGCGNIVFGTDWTYKSEVTTDGARGRSKGVGGTEDGAAGLDGVAAFPDHGADGAGAHVCDSMRKLFVFFSGVYAGFCGAGRTGDESGEEGLAG
jgi:hypothetical protein